MKYFHKTLREHPATKLAVENGIADIFLRQNPFDRSLGSNRDVSRRFCLPLDTRGTIEIHVPPIVVIAGCWQTMRVACRAEPVAQSASAALTSDSVDGLVPLIEVLYALRLQR
jgi:hypothetical protein